MKRSGSQKSVLIRILSYGFSAFAGKSKDVNH